MDDLHDPPIVVLHEILDYMFWCTFRESLLISDVFGNALYHKESENTHTQKCYDSKFGISHMRIEMHECSYQNEHCKSCQPNSTFEMTLLFLMD